MEYTDENYKNAKRDELFEFICPNCGKHFFKYKWQISKCKGVPPKYCSRECAKEARKSKFIDTKCSFCGKDIKVLESQYKRSKSKKFFCSSSHAASFNNKGRKQTSQTKDKISKTITEKNGNIWDGQRNEIRFYDACPICGNKKYKTSDLCYKCSNKEARIKYRSLTLREIIGEKPKYTATLCGSIRRDARRTLIESNVEKVCAYCKNHEYDEILEVHHLKGIMSFDKNATINDINSVDNLVWLCPNHHTMLEKGMIKL